MSRIVTTSGDVAGFNVHAQRINERVGGAHLVVVQTCQSPEFGIGVSGWPELFFAWHGLHLTLSEGSSGERNLIERGRGNLGVCDVSSLVERLNENMHWSRRGDSADMHGSFGRT